MLGMISKSTSSRRSSGDRRRRRTSLSMNIGRGRNTNMGMSISVSICTATNISTYMTIYETGILNDRIRSQK